MRSSTRSRALARNIRRAVGPARFRRLRQRDQHRGLRQRQPARLLAEIRERCGARAFEIAAIGREAEIEREDFVFAQRAFELDRARHLPQFRTEAALAARLHAAAQPAWSASSRPTRSGRSRPGARRRAEARPDRRHDANGSACLHTRSASRRNADRHRRRWLCSRQRPSSAEYGRSSRPSRSTTSVEKPASSTRGNGPSE